MQAAAATLACSEKLAFFNESIQEEQASLTLS